ncbi:P-loop containing nucleoside triphosphate hydrolase protein [Tribonema minus]|uniref:P-loop containing nucleoside triphosphate hydrolase protein n=1 Tax=Tribonema minus TaxID=303371 RepID=A0A835Z9E9_9STRA|nr:P-loop containing nucleoside triphosphate hydrolase protein [Tribonema minus]
MFMLNVRAVTVPQEELAEVVDFLRDARRYEAMGARLPRGILLSGPSGTGKTLLARAVAAESRVPFISCSASDFVEMLVGRGASRVRDLFKRGAAAAPCIIFVDELDALAKARGGLNSNDEREQTLNQLLTELDGFDSSVAASAAARGGPKAASRRVVVIAATNRPEVLDPALTRPGRFDRHVHVGLPDERGRVSILTVHMRKVRAGPDVDLRTVARETAGFSGAELANIVNEAALLAVRGGGESVQAEHMRSALSRAKAYRSLYSVEYRTMLQID